MNNIAPLASSPIIVGAGLAGLTTALSLAPMPVVVLCAGKLGTQSSSVWAQGGIAAALGEDDTAVLHADDTIKAGNSFCDPQIAKLVTEGGADVIEKLASFGVIFDRDAAGRYQLGLEAAHSRRRIVHIGGDGAGQAIMQAVITAVRTMPSITVMENTTAIELLADESGITGVTILRDGKREMLATNRVVLATGGAGALWGHTTNPRTSWGCGLALAARTGAELIDLEFMQFHPTAIDIGRDPMPLASEALRGEGAIFADETGARFMADFPRAELEPRDVVARAIHAHMNKGHRVFLDARKALGANFAARFPAIHAICLSAGIDPAEAPIPVRPAAHYHMGGIKVNAMGRSSVTGLWACGEVAATGLHGANRLASNSLLEAAFFGSKVAEDISGVGDRGSGVRDQKRERSSFGRSHTQQRPPPLEGGDRGGVEARTNVDVMTQNIRSIMSKYLGVLRDKEGLETAIDQLTPLASNSDMALTALLIATAALRRKESRGSHTRTDYPKTIAQAQRETLTLKDVISETPAISLPRAAGA